MTAALIYFAPSKDARPSQENACARLCAPNTSRVKDVRQNPFSNDSFRNRVVRTECFCGSSEQPIALPTL